jgi:hypothetical protein
MPARDENQRSGKADSGLLTGRKARHHIIEDRRPSEQGARIVERD